MSVLVRLSQSLRVAGFDLESVSLHRLITKSQTLLICPPPPNFNGAALPSRLSSLISHGILSALEAWLPSWSYHATDDKQWKMVHQQGTCSHGPVASHAFWPLSVYPCISIFAMPSDVGFTELYLTQAIRQVVTTHTHTFSFFFSSQTLLVAPRLGHL